VLLDAVVQGLNVLPQTRLDRLPRMADFALWATACETALWPGGTFWSAYCGNRDEVVEDVIDADPIAAAVRAVVATRTEWTGTASDLLGALAEVVGERAAKSKTWPDSPRALAGRLRRAATFLRKIGIEISFRREGQARTRTIHLATTPAHSTPEDAGARPSAPSASSASMPKSSLANGSAAQSMRTVANDADGSGQGSASTVRSNPLKTNAGTAANGADAKIPSQSASKKKWTAEIAVPQKSGTGEAMDAAASVLGRLRASSISVRLDGDGLLLEADGPQQPPNADSMVFEVARHGTEIFALLRLEVSVSQTAQAAPLPEATGIQKPGFPEDFGKNGGA
jgi:hypothetical protein